MPRRRTQGQGYTHIACEFVLPQIPGSLKVVLPRLRPGLCARIMSHRVRATGKDIKELILGSLGFLIFYFSLTKDNN
jgi:hypothetical protein